MRATIGEQVRRARQDAGLTLNELAERLSCSKTTLSLLENGHRPVTPTWAARIEDALALDGMPLLARVCWASLPDAIRDQLPQLDVPHDDGRVEVMPSFVSKGLDEPLAASWQVDEVGVPTIDSADTVAVRVTHGGLLPRFDLGDVIVCTTRPVPYHGRLCAVRFVDDDRVMLTRVLLEREGDEPEDGDDIILMPVVGEEGAVRVERDDLERITPAICLIRALDARPIDG